MEPSQAALWQTIFSGLSVGILLLTLVTLIFYTKYTYDMQREVARQAADSVRQTRLSIMPAFYGEFVETNEVDPVWDLPLEFPELVNIGSGVALNIQIAPLELKYEAELLKGGNLIFERLAFLRPGERKIVKATSRYDEKPSKDDHTRDIRYKRREGRAFSLIVHFQDIEATSYSQTLVLGPDGCSPGPVVLKS